MFFLPSKKFSWIVLALFFAFDAFSSYYAVRYMGAKEGNPIIAPYVQQSPILFFPIMMFGYVLVYFIYFILKTVFFTFLKKFKYITKILIEKIILASIAIFYFFTVILNNSLFIFGLKIPGMLTINLIIGLVTATFYGVLTLFIFSKTRK
jgi:hypothetical protein